MKKAITCASRRTVFCIVALLAVSACLGIMVVVLHRPQPAATGLSIRMNDQKIRLFDTPEEALSAAAEAPAAAEENRLRLSWEGGALTHNVQAYMRAASEGEQGLQTSPYAVVYNFTPKKTEDVMYLRDITDGEKADGTLEEYPQRTNVWAWKHPHGDGTVTYTKLAGRVVFDHVDFGYTPDKEVLHDITLYAEPGQKVAFVGATGAGKTTITNLINRFYDIADGQILYDGIDVSKIKKADLRRSLGIVLQDVNLFTGTVMDNIRYGKLNATDEECIAAAKLAGADDFITRLPQGYATELANNGANLSQGQRQLISIARAAVADPPVMILDEATSSIDTRTEAIVQRGMDQLMEGRTVFVIAHRLSTVKNSDVIMVLDHGRIIERGSHEKLIAEKGTYYQLYTGAFELE